MAECMVSHMLYSYFVGLAVFGECSATASSNFWNILSISLQVPLLVDI